MAKELNTPEQPEPPAPLTHEEVVTVNLQRAEDGSWNGGAVVMKGRMEGGAFVPSRDPAHRRDIGIRLQRIPKMEPILDDLVAQHDEREAKRREAARLSEEAARMNREAEGGR